MDVFACSIINIQILALQYKDRLRYVLVRFNLSQLFLFAMVIQRKLSFKRDIKFEKLVKFMYRKLSCKTH